ncbi:unnamed protein product [Heligmosomoides polygyrus]|uniref:Maelstrom domain-containing protein n=1 Tax=Heligmosomoides polygyrus TaxID=6339 RepID=A0A183GA64_HELPZ|nr:unnamed protein product [Heligmosomoides polygyrus]
MAQEANFKRQPASKAKNKNRNAYFEWHQKVGRFEFRQRFGRDYNQEMEDDKLLMTELWQAVKEQWDKGVKLRKGKLKGPLVDFASVLLQFIAVYPYTVAVSRSGELLVYPAEVSITHYTLRNGTSARFSKLVNFLPKEFYGRGLPEWDQEEVVKNAQKLDVSLKQPQGASPAEAWRSLMQHCNSRAITLCDANQIAVVDSALYFLASTAGPEQMEVYKELMGTIITVQDLVKALFHRRDRGASEVFERVDKEFKKLRETALCCSYHGKKPPQAPSRQLCPVAKAETLMLVQLYGSFFKDFLNI